MCVSHLCPRRPTGAYQHAAARHRTSSPHKHRLSMDSGQTLCVQDEEGRPGAGPRRASSWWKGRHVPGNHSSGQRVLCPTEGQWRAREQQGRLPPCRAPAAICALGSHLSARPQYIDGIKSQAPRATSTASTLTDSWHGSDQFPWKSTHLLAAKDMCKLWVYPSVSFKP